MEKVAKALEWLKQGGLIIVVDDETREAEGDLVGLAQYATPETINFMVTHARGLICAPMAPTIAQQLALTEMSKHNTDAYGTAFTISVDHKTTSTGISTHDRAQTIAALAQTKVRASDFLRPGHIFPLIAKSGGVLERQGHTEAAVDLAKLAKAAEVAYICEILKEDGTMARFNDLEVLAEKWQLPLISVAEIAAYRLEQEKITVALPTKWGDFSLQLFEDEQKKEHILLSKGALQSGEEPLLVRLHSECLTGDVFGSQRCDCGEQLEKAMSMISQEGRGAILYLRQEGRGIGLKAKLAAYQLQEQRMDTYEANIALGFAADEREYSFAAKLLKNAGVKKVALLTNNPDKVQELERHGIAVAERVPLEITPNVNNTSYLKTKQEKFHHYLSV